MRKVLFSSKVHAKTKPSTTPDICNMLNGGKMDIISFTFWYNLFILLPPTLEALFPVEFASPSKQPYSPFPSIEKRREN